VLDTECLVQQTRCKNTYAEHCHNVTHTGGKGVSHLSYTGVHILSALLERNEREKGVRERERGRERERAESDYR
jgi:hypothetical protein